jgi:hypothetical protein
VIIVELFFYALIAVIVFQIGRMLWKKVSKASRDAYEKHLRGD